MRYLLSFSAAIQEPTDQLNLRQAHRAVLSFLTRKKHFRDEAWPMSDDARALTFGSVSLHEVAKAQYLPAPS